MIRRIRILLIFSLLTMVHCVNTSGGLKVLAPPDDNTHMIVGNVLIENINQEFAFDDWGMSSELVILGKTLDGALKQYPVNTDGKGYYCLPNVPPGQYVVKVVTVPIVGAKPLKLINESTSSEPKFYRMRHPEQPVEYAVDWLPARTTGRIIDLNIIWFGLRAAPISDISTLSIGEVLAVKSRSSLAGKRFYEKGFPYTREDPLTYFKNKFPNSEWWK